MPLNYRMDRLSGRIVGSSSKSAYSPKVSSKLKLKLKNKDKILK